MSAVTRIDLSLIKRFRHHILTVAVGFVVGLSAIPTSAKADTSSFSEWLNQPTMTGDWGGVRTTLANDGIKTKAILLGQLGDNVSGGKRQGFDYDQQLVAGADWDLQKLIGLRGGSIHTYVEDRVGRGLTSDYVGGSIQQLGFYGSGENFRLSELSYEQNFLHKRVNTLIGYYVLSTQFAYTPLLCNSNFMGNDFCGHPQFLGTNTSGYQLGPVASWGGRVSFLLKKNLYFAVGAYEVNPILTKNDKGFDLSFDDATGAVIPAEIGLTTKFGPSGLVGHYKIGGLYDTSKVVDVEYSKISRTGRYDGWILIDQMVYRMAPGSNRGITVFAEGGIGDKRTALEDSYIGGGFVFQGPFASRPYDNLNFGWVHATVNPRLIKLHDSLLTAAQNRNGFSLEPGEENIEVGYNIQATRWLAVTPDAQYVIDPGATNFQHYHNAIVLGAQFKIFM